VPLINERYPGGPPPLWRVLRNMVLLSAVGLLVAWFLVECGGAERPHAPRHPIPASTGASR